MRNLIIGTAGHIDHGKTELIKALTGVDTDRLKDEKERGISTLRCFHGEGVLPEALSSGGLVESFQRLAVCHIPSLTCHLRTGNRDRP